VVSLLTAATPAGFAKVTHPRADAEPMSATADRERVAEDPIEIPAGFRRSA
jgi:hypothetical protein